MAYTQEQIHGIIMKQRQFFRTGKTLDVTWRIEQLKKLKQAVIDRQKELEDALQEDLCKSDTEAYLCDIGPVIVEVNEILRGIRRWARPERHFSGLMCFPSIGTTVYKMPYGVSLIISPFNFPILLTLGVLVLSGIAVFLFVRSALRPLRKMTEAAGNIAEGDFSVRVDEKRGGRELKEVSHAFNTMTKKLQGVEEGRREFVANVSHELRSPITSIRGFAEAMADGVIPPEEQPDTMRLVAAESRRLSDLIDDLLELSRLEREDAKPDWSVFDINEMLRRAIIRRMSDLEKKDIDVSCEFETDPCLVRADSGRIEEVVINLLDNAIKFTEQGGKITLSSRVRGDKAEITVRDNGIGVAEEDREKIFDRFFTADRAHTSGKGTGLGLSICRRIMEMHGQSLRLLDTDVGAAFRFTLEYAGETEEQNSDLTET